MAKDYYTYALTKDKGKTYFIVRNVFEEITAFKSIAKAKEEAMDFKRLNGFYKTARTIILELEGLIQNKTIKVTYDKNRG